MKRQSLHGLNLSPFGTKELTAQVVHLDSAASSHIHTTSELLYVIRLLWLYIPLLSNLNKRLQVDYVNFQGRQGTQLPSTGEGAHGVTACKGM